MKDIKQKRDQQCFYLTGTDTDVGKTIISAAILKAFASRGYSSLGMKPIASGCELFDGKLKNSDALLLQRNSSESIPYDELNPYTFRPAIAPHIAAQESDVSLNVDQLLQASKKIQSYQTDITIIEGAGGWFVPLNNKETLADFAIGLDMPVILVVAIRLGCINHALLSVHAIEKSGLTIAGWVANCCSKSTVDQERRYQENIDSIELRINAPLLATIPFLEDECNLKKGGLKKNNLILKEQKRVDQAAQYFAAVDFTTRSA